MTQHLYTCIWILKLCWSICIFKSIKMSVTVNIHICIHGLIIVVMSSGMLEHQLTSCLSLWHLPLARILTGRCLAVHVPNLRHLQWSFQISIIYILGSHGQQLSTFLILSCLTLQRSTLAGVEQYVSKP